MSRSNDERLLDLRTLVRRRLERDLHALADISLEKSELSLRDILDEVQYVYVHYLQQDALLNVASSNIGTENEQIQEEIQRLRSIDS